MAKIAWEVGDLFSLKNEGGKGSKYGMVLPEGRVLLVTDTGQRTEKYAMENYVGVPSDDATPAKREDLPHDFTLMFWAVETALPGQTT
jgi:hypothetical protein